MSRRSLAQWLCVLASGLSLLTTLPAQAAAKPPAAPKPAPAGAQTQAFPPIESVPHPINAGFAETPEERPRLAVLLKGTPAEFGKQLLKALELTRRFEMVDAPADLVNARSALQPGITVAQCRALRQKTKVDRVLICDLREATGDVRVNTRMIWLDNGEVSREMAMFGKSTAAKTLALQLATFVRRETPLRCLVRALAEDHVVLDLGETSGMIKGTTFQVIRYATNLKPLTIGTVRVTALEPFAARAEVEDAAKDQAVAPGDVAIEQTSEMGLY
jgi:hypothetical protein